MNNSEFMEIKKINTNLNRYLMEGQVEAALVLLNFYPLVSELEFHQ